MTVTFSILSPFNVCNNFRVEMSNNSGGFTGNFVEIAPKVAANIGVYTMDIVIDPSSPQGAYSFRLRGTNPVYTSDTVKNIIIGANPATNITIYNAYDKNGEQTICEGDTAILVGPQPGPGDSYTYEWFVGGGPSGLTDDTLIVTSSDTYSIEVGLGLCKVKSTDTIVNTYNPPTQIYATGGGFMYIGQDSINMCYGTTATLNVAAFPTPATTFEYRWIKNDSIDIFGKQVYYYTGDTTATLAVDTAGEWFIEVTSLPGGCVDTSKAFMVFVDTVPSTVVFNQPWPGQVIPKTTLCLADSTLLTANDTLLNTTWEYQWQIAYPSGSSNWQALANDTLPWLVVDTSIIADTADYRLFIQNGMCSFATNQFTIGYVPYPTLAILPSDSVGICVEDSALITLQSSGLSFSWNGGAFVGKQNFLSDPGQYIITATGVNQCKSYDTLDIFNYQLNATATANPQTIEPGEFTNLSATGGNTYFWYSDIPSAFSNAHAATTDALPGGDTTTFYIEVEDINGCTDTASVEVYVVEVKDSATIYYETYSNIQNVITPNGDDKNDVLNLEKITNGDDCIFDVYTRWGTPVYHQDVYNNNWGGTTQGGAPLNDGTYIVILSHNNKIRYKGAVTILNNF